MKKIFLLIFFCSVILFFVHWQDKNIQQLKTRVAVLEQELLDKEQLVARITSSLDSAQQQKVSFWSEHI